MKNICFIGAYDKMNFVLCIAKILKLLGNKILIVDATELQKSKYIVPTISPVAKYITRFEDMDIALGFESYNDVEKYIEETEELKMQYDYALINIDDQDKFVNFNNADTIKNYFVTTLELYAIRKGLDTLKKISKPIQVTKIVFSKNLSQDDEYYIDYLALGYKIIWEENKIVFPYLMEDIEAMMENQRNYKIRIKNLSYQYKEMLEILMLNMLPDLNKSDLRRIMKNIEREG